MANVNVPSYCKKYLRMKAEVAQIFDDLELFLNFVRLQNPAVPFNPSDLYNYRSPMWQKYERQRNRKFRNEQGRVPAIAQPMTTQKPAHRPNRQR